MQVCLCRFALDGHGMPPGAKRWYVLEKVDGAESSAVGLLW